MGLYNVIQSQPVTFPSKPAVSPALKDITAKMLCKDPALRISLPAVMQHPWTTHGNNLPLLCRQVQLSTLCLNCGRLVGPVLAEPKTSKCLSRSEAYIPLQLTAC